MSTYTPYPFPLPSKPKLPPTIKTLLTLILTEPYPSEIGFAPLETDDNFQKVEESGFSALAINAKKLGELALKTRELHDKHPSILSTYVYVILQPSSQTHYNLRRKYILGLGSERELEGDDEEDENEYLKILKGELYLTSVILIRTGKSGNCWEYRKFILQILLDLHEDISEIIDTELTFLNKITTYYPKNYYAYNYRRYILSHSDSHLLSDLEFTIKGLKLNTTDNSRVSHINWLLDSGVECDLKGVLKDLEVLGESYPEQKTIWRCVRCIGVRCLDVEIMERWYNDILLISKAVKGRQCATSKDMILEDSKLKCYVWVCWVKSREWGEKGVEGRMAGRIIESCFKELERREQPNSHITKLKEIREDF